MGEIKLQNNVHLTEVLFVPCFKFNLLSIKKLTNTNLYSFVFSDSKWMIQDQRTYEVIVTGKVLNNLYILKPSNHVDYAFSKPAKYTYLAVDISYIDSYNR